MSRFAEYQPGVGAGPLPVDVRPAAKADIDAIDEVQRESGRTPYGERLSAAISSTERIVVVATYGDSAGTETAVGWAQTYHLTAPTDPAPAGHYLGGVTVAPSWRRRYVGVRLIEARITWVAQRADEVFYVVNPANLASIELHRRWGFTEVDRGSRLCGVEFTGGVGLLMRADLGRR